MIAASLVVMIHAALVCGENRALITGEVRAQVNSDLEAQKPKEFRLPSESFRYEMRLVQESAELDIRVYEVKFPSAVSSRYEVNNMVCGMYYRPNCCDERRVPGVIILDILDGSQRVARAQALYLASRGMAAMTIYLPYYGPRRPGNVRFLSPNLEHVRQAMGQAVADVRRAAAWLLERPEIDRERLAILGTSFGSFVAALSAEMEPAFQCVVLLLGGGGLVDAYYEHPRARPYRKIWEALGGTKERLRELIAPLDPVTYADRLKNRRVLILAGKRDEIVPPQAAQALAKACPNATLLWFDCTHHGAILYFVPAMELAIRHIRGENGGTR